jgi:hypothetical protein
MNAHDVQAVRPNPRRLVMATGHATAQDRVVLKHDGYVIVELAGGAAS